MSMPVLGRAYDDARECLWMQSVAGETDDVFHFNEYRYMAECQLDPEQAREWR